MEFCLLIYQVISEVVIWDPVLMFVKAQYCTEEAFDTIYDGIQSFIMLKSNKPVIDDIDDINRELIK